MSCGADAIHWMDEGDGLDAGRAIPAIESPMQVIGDYVASHPQTDPARVHLKGCSNGGYMTLNMAPAPSDHLPVGAPGYGLFYYEFPAPGQRSLSN